MLLHTLNKLEKHSPVVKIRANIPDSILHHILFFLPAKDAAQTSVLSKTWLKVWNLLLFFTFDFDQNLYLRKLGKEESQQVDVTDAFSSIVDGSLMNLRFQKAIIEKFRLSLKLSCLKNAFCIDEWIRMVTNNCIKELDLDITRLDAKEDWYSLPGTVFTAKSLMVLRLRGLKLEWPLIVNHINLSKLKELSLTDVFLEERIILEICSACPEIEDLRLIRCQGVKDLLTSDLPNLLKLTIDQQFETIKKSIQIRAVFLRTLYYSGCNITVKFDVSKFKHLKELGITFGEITDSIVENIVAELPLLEELELSFCLKSMRLKFSSCVLRKLTFYSTKSLTEIGMDTPNLLHYTYRAPKLPVIFSMTPSSIQESFLQLKPDDHLNTIWFENLREHLTRFKKLNSLFLRIESATVSVHLPLSLCCVMFIFVSLDLFVGFKVYEKV
ncbi:F-box/LRR-repeat protein At3g59190-like [Capsicum annuum]|uniref:F-box/LRR-repeat protein At3g59190-like n=1 Tax=Capsicum annuum TaxID=4072 RepID=UPI001FB13151|nr:F-box/LRR-repeat protein At3g59190-like [Capsicum annuum]